MQFEQALDATLAMVVVGAPTSVTNQYTVVDQEHDHPAGPARRQANLRHYLMHFRQARWLLCAEAAGYNGARFSGITLCDEHKLVGPDHLEWAGEGAGFSRGSREDRPLHVELSASVVWKALGNRRDVLLWNAVPWHPAGPDGPLTNRTPTPAERRAGLAVLAFVLQTLLPSIQPVAVGRVAQGMLAQLGRPNVPCLRHPAHGGARLFSDGLQALFAAD